MKHALIIEDQPLIATTAEDVLGDLGFNSVVTATSQEEAIALAKLRCPDIIVADERLESGSGLAAVRHICRDNTIPVVFLTGDPASVEGMIENALVLEKPVPAHKLHNAICSVLLIPSA
jgi:CheY-like chemotaxis protein